MYKCAIIGVSGGRARGHANAYSLITRGRLAAIATRRRDRLDAFGETYGVAARYTDYREMLARERPDLVHVNTPPDVRLEIFEAAAEAGVPALIVEKPLAIQWEDFLALQRFAGTAKVRIAVNHQLHFHPRRQTLQRFVADGKLGQLRFIDASSRMNMAYQGTHTLQAIGAFNSGAPLTVLAQAAGAAGLQETPRRHYAPDQCAATITYDNGVSALLRCGTNAPVATTDEHVAMHKRIAVYGTRGFVNWTMGAWETCSDGHYDSGQHVYAEEDVIGQAAMTEAMFDWLADPAQVHPLNLDTALRDFHLLLNIYTSARRRQQRSLTSVPETAPEANLIASLRNCL